MTGDARAAWRPAATRPLAGKVALVTGSRFGIGRAIAKALAASGADVVVTSRRGDDLSESEARIRDEGSNVLSVALDVRNTASAQRAVDVTMSRFGRLDILVNNAAVALRQPFEEFSEDDWQEVIDTNLGGVFRMMRVTSAALAASGDGRVVNVSSTYARVAARGRAVYGASKAGIEQLTRALAVEWADRGITVNAVAPTTVLTETRQHLLDDPAFLPARLAEIPLGRLCEVEDVANAIVWLVGPGAGYVTGNVVMLDGGLALR